jgi:hypothetical protein
MDDLRETVESALGGLEKLAQKLPGYGGYKEKEMRREADKILRMEIAGKFDEQRQRLSDVQGDLLSAAKIEYLDDVERIVMKLQLLVDRVKTASYGYAGLFDAIKVKEEQLDALYEFDERMLDYVDDVAAGTDAVSSAITAEGDIAAALGDLKDIVAEALLTFSHREESILQAESYDDDVEYADDVVSADEL